MSMGKSCSNPKKKKNVVYSLHYIFGPLNLVGTFRLKKYFFYEVPTHPSSQIYQQSFWLHLYKVCKRPERTEELPILQSRLNWKGLDMRFWILFWIYMRFKALKIIRKSLPIFQLTALPLKWFGSAELSVILYKVYTIYLSLCTQTGDPNHFQGNGRYHNIPFEWE